MCRPLCFDACLVDYAAYVWQSMGAPFDALGYGFSCDTHCYFYDAQRLQDALKEVDLVVGSLGVAFIIAGAILPYIELGDRSTNTEQAQSVASTTSGTEESNLTEAAAPG